MSEPAGTICRIARYAVHDGPGIRTTIFLKGCPLRCVWCHSPETQKSAPELMVHPDRCARCGQCLDVCPHHAVERVDDRFLPGPRCVACGSCIDQCPHGAREVSGRTVTVSLLMREIEKDRLFYDDSGGGVTFSGGEPLMQPQFLKALLDACRAREIHSVVDTSGYATPAVLARIEPDLFLFDLKMIDDGKHQKTTGVSNRRILANARALRARGANVRLRSPLVPGVNDEDDDLRALGRVVQSLGHPEIDLLPYHRAGLAKYARLNRSYALADTPEPTAAHVERARAVLAAAGISTHVGG